jgi:hypothetical protein
VIAGTGYGQDLGPDIDPGECRGEEPDEFGYVWAPACGDPDCTHGETTSATPTNPEEQK